jgi:hypothetical protein
MSEQDVLTEDCEKPGLNLALPFYTVANPE